MAVVNRAGQNDPQKPRLASLNPDDMVQGGLADDFDGWMRVFLVPWTYPDDSLDHYMLAGRVDFTPDPESGLEPFSEYYACGNKSLLGFVPSMDGVNPAGATFEEYALLASGEAERISKEAEEAMKGVFALGTPSSKVEGLNNNSKFNEFTDAIKEIINSASPALLKSAGWMGWNPSSECLTLYGHFNRVAGRERGGLQRADGKRKPQILVMTELKAAPSGKPAVVSQPTAATQAPSESAATASPTLGPATPAPATASAAGTDGDLKTRLADAVVFMLREKGVVDPESGFKTLPSKKLPALMLLPDLMKQFDGVERREGVNTVGSAAFLSSDVSDGRWLFDPSNGIVTGLEA